MLSASAGPALARAPSFFGIVPQGPLTARDYTRLPAVGGTIRVPFYWFQVEATRGEPDFAATDSLVGAAAEHGLAVLPFIYGTPPWLSADPARPPLASPAARNAWVEFLRRLVDRYGPRGSFWRGRQARMPIRRWQLWNEPNFRLFWHPRPAPLAYARLLRLGARAVRGADPGARILAAGVAPVEAGMLPWSFLRRMYRAPGVRRDFDVVAVHPYAVSLASLEYQLAKVRQVMRRAGDAATPVQVTEIGTASGSSYATLFDMGPQGQAQYLKGAYRLFAENRRRWHLVGIDWFTWRDGSSSDLHCSFCEFAGLLDGSGRRKPAWWALRSVVNSTALWERAGPFPVASRP